MEDKNKNQQNRAPREENGQRISVRAGNFTPPTEHKTATPDANRAQNQNGGANGNGGGKSKNRRRGRRGGKNHQPREDRPVAENRNAEARQNQGQKQTPPVNANANAGNKNSAGSEGNHKSSRHRRGRRGGKGGAHQQNAPREEVLQSTLPTEQNDAFSTPTLLDLSTFGTQQKREAEQSVLDSEEFAVDIATASYLLDDIPCGFPIPDGKAIEVIGVRFREAGRVYFFAPNGFKFTIGDRVIVDTARGPEIGGVVMLNRKIAEKDIIQPLRAVLRPATPEDLAHDKENRAKEIDALKVCERKIGIHKLDMHLVDAQYTFDNSKLLFYFTSDGRVDFRELVHDLAGHFHTRIELRQIGIRDEARLVGGLGMCGRPFCCSTYLSDFGQVSVKMAKEQGLSINASKISGCCGRLMCCLRYEHETYVAETKLTPKKDTAVITPDGEGVVVDNSPLAGTVRVRLDATPEEAPKTYHRDTLTVLGKAQKHTAENAKGKNTNDKT